jgi:soluble lytic murein transglycosylase-like protein
MSVVDVTARIGQIQAQLALLGPGRTSSTPATGFADALSGATTDLTSAGSGDGAAVVAEARKYLGVPYVWGGTDPAKGLDCSGLVQVVYKNLGYDLPRVSYQQAQSGRAVEGGLANARPGDLIAWDNSSRNNGVDHIAIYIGDGKMIEAPRPGANVRIAEVTTPPDVIRRIVPDVAPAGGATAARVSGSTPFSDLFNDASARYDVPATLLSAIAKQESGYRPGAVSPAGAQGLMQLMPATARGLGVTDSFDPRQAVDGAAKLMRSLIDRFGRTDLALAAYNAGPGAVLRYDGIPPYPETQRYVRNVMATWRAS